MLCVQRQLIDHRIFISAGHDYEFNYGEEVTLTPRNYPFPLRHQNADGALYHDRHCSYGGDYPLYDAVNEKDSAWRD